MKKKQGFTLIELLVAMTIIAILAALALVSLQGSRQAARDARRKADLEEIRAALEMCRADTGSYPEIEITATADVPRGIRCGDENVTYLDPVGDPGAYGYYYNSDGVTYILCAHLESGGVEETDCGANCRGTCNYKVTQP